MNEAMHHVDEDSQMAAGDDSAPGPEFRVFGLLAIVPEGGMIPAYHGAYRLDTGAAELRTAVMPLNKLLVLAWGLYRWLKMGRHIVNADPRQAFMDGYEACKRDHPENLQRWEEALEQREEQLQQFATNLAQREANIRAANHKPAH